LRRLSVSLAEGLDLLDDPDQVAEDVRAVIGDEAAEALGASLGEACTKVIAVARRLGFAGKD
jgi:hypothetical protein